MFGDEKKEKTLTKEHFCALAQSSADQLISIWYAGTATRKSSWQNVESVKLDTKYLRAATVTAKARDNLPSRRTGYINVLDSRRGGDPY